jgi:hypothetical protein
VRHPAARPTRAGFYGRIRHASTPLEPFSLRASSGGLIKAIVLQD